MDSVTSAVSCFFASPRLAASRIFVPISNFLAVSLAIARASPVTILTFTPIASAVAIVTLASSRGGSNSGNTPRNCHCPSPSARATPSERKPRAANSLTACSTATFTCAELADSAMITLYAHCQRGRDCDLGVISRRIEQRQHAQKLPLPVTLGPRHAQRTEAEGDGQ